MPSLLDIGDLTEPVTIRGKVLQVQGISAEGLFALLKEFPELRKLMTGNADEAVIASLTEKLPESLGMIIAAGTGTPGNEEAGRKARMLAVGEQIQLIHAIWKLTFPRGVKDFIEALEALTGELGDESGKAPGTKSPGPSSDASDPGTLQK